MTTRQLNLQPLHHRSVRNTNQGLGKRKYYHLKIAQFLRNKRRTEAGSAILLLRIFDFCSDVLTCFCFEARVYISLPPPKLENKHVILDE
jgi:hypothetical protein